jgi:site-specific DNA-methyltransferase (adenine-specific)
MSFNFMTGKAALNAVQPEEKFRVYNGYCLDIMPKLAGTGIKADLILCDLPYGTTHNSWDCPIDLDALWNCCHSLMHPTTAVCLFAQPPFDKILGSSNLSELRYEWIIEKTKPTGFLNAKRMPMKAHENVLVFYQKLPVFNPQMTTGMPPVHSFTKHSGDGTNYGKTKSVSGGGSTERYPRDVLKFSWDTQKSKIHPTQKPLKCMDYFIRTYSNPGDVVIDMCMGSGTTGVACIAEGRKFIGIEKDPEMFDKALKRILSSKDTPDLLQ